MISLLRGLIHSINGQTVVLDVSGVGYEIWGTAACIERLNRGEEAEVIVYTDVKQDSIRLFGFRDRLEKQVFLLLTEVKGIGPRTSADIISHVDSKDLLRAISAGDIHALQAVKGVGKKTAERIMVELKDKVASLIIEKHAPAMAVEKEVITPSEEALQALMALGFPRRDAERALESAAAAGAITGSAASSAIVKEALRFV